MVKKKYLVFALLGAGATVAFGQLSGIPGLPTVVWDPAQDGHAVAQIAHEIEQIELATNQYIQMTRNAMYFGNKSAWRGWVYPTVNSVVQNTVGETAGWTEALNYGADAESAWRVATVQTPPMPWLGIGGDNPTAAFSTNQILDGASIATMTTVSNAKQAMEQNDAAITNLEGIAQDGSDDTNTEVQQLNQISAGTLLVNRQQKATNQLLTVSAEQLLGLSKVFRDGNASYVSENSQADQYLLNQPANWGGSAATISNYQQ